MRVSMPQGEQGTPISLVGMVYAPEIGRVANQFSSITYTASKLSLREFEAARMITAHINGCQLCQNWRSATDLPLYLKGLGHDASHSVADHGAVPDDGFYAAVADWRIADIFSPRERIALEMAERMGTEPKAIAGDEDFWVRAHAVFTDAEIVDLAYCIACWMGLGRMTHVLGLDGLCSLPTARAPVAA